MGYRNIFIICGVHKLDCHEIEQYLFFYLVMQIEYQAVLTMFTDQCFQVLFTTETNPYNIFVLSCFEVDSIQIHISRTDKHDVEQFSMAHTYGL